VARNMNKVLGAFAVIWVPSPLRGLTGGIQRRLARMRNRARSDRQFRRHRPYPVPPLIGQGGLGGLMITDRVLDVSPCPGAIGINNPTDSQYNNSSLALSPEFAAKKG